MTFILSSLSKYIYSSCLCAQVSLYKTNRGPEVYLNFISHLCSVSASASSCIQELVEGETFLVNHLLMVEDLNVLVD